jgi:hypothetical protein
LSSQSLGLVERQIQAEYYLKSLVNFAAGLIKADSTPDIDATGDPWGPYVNGLEIPQSIQAALGIADPGVRIFLEIRPSNAALRVDNTNLVGTLQPKMRDILARLFNLVLPEKLQSAEDHLGRFPRSFSINDMAANLIDYFDADKEAYNEDGFTGIESEDNQDIFRSEGKISSVKELSRIPGFTPERLRYLAPYLAVSGDDRININVAGPKMIQALSKDISADMAQAIVDDIAKNGPVSDVHELEQRIPGFNASITRDITSFTAGRTKSFIVIGKIEYGSQGSYFIRARVQKDTGLDSWPVVRSMELY